MYHLNRYLGSLVLAAALITPVVVMAGAPAQEANVQVRVYDRDHRDYHNWDDREDRAYRHYLEERHEAYLGFHRQHHKVQRHYWKWRHEHPDHD